MRRLLWLPLILSSACTPAQMQVAKETAISWSVCSGLSGTKALAGSVLDVLKLADWRDQLAVLGAGQAAGMLECATAEAVRFLRSQHKSSSMVAMEPQSDKAQAAERGEEWLRARGWKGDV